MCFLVCPWAVAERSNIDEDLVISNECRGRMLPPPETACHVFAVHGGAHQSNCTLDGVSDNRYETCDVNRFNARVRACVQRFQTDYFVVSRWSF